MHFLYQAYGTQVIIGQTLLSIASLRRHTGPAFGSCTIVIYTDDSSAFAPALGGYGNVRYETLTPELLRQWRGPLDFVHRAKVCMLRDYFVRYQAPVCYLDSDTLFTQNPLPPLQQLAPTHSWMHILEETLERPRGLLLRKIGRFVQRHSFTWQGSSYRIPRSTPMWNAGVLGIHSTFAPHLEQVIAITDQGYAAYPKHIIEQMAFSYMLHNHTQIHSADGFVFHYWMLKDEVNANLDQLRAGTLTEDSFFTTTLPQLQQLAVARLVRLPWWQKLLRKLRS